MENNFDIQFKKLKESVNLTGSEKEFHKSQILRFMEKSGTATPVASPFQFHFSPHAKILTTGFALFLFLTTGLVSSAKSSLPNEYLYVFRIKVVEPLQVFLARGIKEKNDTRIALIGDRLEDFSKVSLRTKLNPEEKARFAEYFSITIKEVQEEITRQATEEDVSEALSAANDLQSVLSAHSVVMDKLRETENADEEKMKLQDTVVATSQLSDLSSNIDEGMDKTREIIGDLTSQLQNFEEAEKLQAALDKQRGELIQSLAKVEDTAEEALKKDGLDAEDQAFITAKLSEIENLLKEGEEKSESGSKKAALNVYNEADQKIGELKTLLSSDKELGIDVLGSSDMDIKISEETKGEVKAEIESE